MSKHDFIISNRGIGCRFKINSTCFVLLDSTEFCLLGYYKYFCNGSAEHTGRKLLENYVSVVLVFDVYRRTYYNVLYSYVCRDLFNPSVSVDVAAYIRASS